MQIEFDSEKKHYNMLEEKYDTLKEKASGLEEKSKEHQRQLAKVEIENDELKNDLR